MISVMLSNNKLNSIVTELFIRGRKLNISLFFITQCYFTVSTKFYLITHQILTLKTLSKNILPNQILF